MNGYRLFRREGRGKRGGGIALYIRKSVQCEELSLNNSHEQVESLWLTIRDRGNKENLVVSVYYRQGEPTDEAFFLQLLEAFSSQSLVSLPIGEFQPT